jgi:hypothetical protein
MWLTENNRCEMTDRLDFIAALKSAGVALIDGGGTDSVSAGSTDDSVVGVEDSNGTGKGGEDEDDGGEGVNEHLGLSS